MSKEIRLSVIAETRKYQSEMAKIPGVTQKQAARAALKFEKEMSKAQAKAAAEASKAAKKSGSAWSDAMSTAAGILSADMVKAFVVAVAGVGQEIADLRNELGDLSAATGVSTEALAGLRLAAESSGNSLGPLEGAIRAFPKALADITMGSGEAKIAFEQLGLTAEDAGEMLKDTDAGFRLVVEKLQAVEGTGKRAELATRAFGEAGITLMQVLGDKRIEEFTYVAQRFGTDVGPDAIKAAQAWEANVTLLGYAFDGAKAGIFDATVGTQAFSEAMRFGIKTSVFFAKTLQNVVSSLELLDLLNPARVALDLSDAYGKARTETLLYMQELDMATSTTMSAAGASDGLASRLEEVAEGAAKAAAGIDKIGQAREELVEIGRAAFTAQLTAQEQLLVGYSKQLAKIKELEDLTGEQAPDTRAAVELNLATELAALEEQQWKDRMAAIDATEAAQDTARDKRIADAEAEHAAKMEQLAEWRDVSVIAAETISEVLGAHAEARQEREEEQLARQLEQLAELRATRDELAATELAQADKFAARQEQINGMGRADARAAAQEQLDLDKQQHAAAASMAAAQNAGDISRAKGRLKRQRDDVRQAAKAAKQAALLGVAVSTSAAILQAFAMFGPPPSPVGIAAAAAAAATGLTEAAAIRRQKLPAAHSGEFIQPDETLRKVRAGEAILNQRAAADVGGAAGVRALNRGGGQGSIVVQTVVDGRVVAEAVGRQLGRRQGTLDRIVRQGRRPLGQLSPYGG